MTQPRLTKEQEQRVRSYWIQADDNAGAMCEIVASELDLQRAELKKKIEGLQ